VDASKSIVYRRRGMGPSVNPSSGAAPFGDTAREPGPNRAGFAPANGALCVVRNGPGANGW
jgi:hypothetical protein